MKKIITMLLGLAMTAALTACAGNTAAEESQTAASVRETETSMPETDGESESLNASASEAEATNVLVAYFSATNTTRPLAEYVADGLAADLYEIVPEDPYEDADLDYNNDDSRSTIEMNDPASRPAIADAAANMEQYDIVFIGYPIWWGEAPRIVSTFMESYDFSGKTIIPFCTSGGSGIGSSGEHLQELTEGAAWIEGQRFGGGESHEDMMEWVNGLGLEITAE